MSKIDATTPVEEVLDDRPTLIRLAQVVFDRTGTNYLRAFSRFRKSSDLAALIQSKREGVFDYGETLIDTENGPKIPKVEDTLEILKKAIDGEVTPEDMEVLGLAAEDFGKVCPAAAGTDKPAKKATKRKAPAKKKPATKTVVRKKPESEGGQVVDFPGAEEVDPAPLGDLGPVMAKLDEFSNNLGTALEGMDAKYGAQADEISGQVAAMRTGLMGVVGLFDVVNKRLDLIGKYFVDEHISWPEVPDEVKAALDALTTSDALAPAKKKAPAKKRTTAKKAAAESPTIVRKKEPEEEEEPPENDGGDMTYTKDDLEEMELDDLRALAASLGVPRAAKIGYKPVAIKKILKKQEAA